MSFQMSNQTFKICIEKYSSNNISIYIIRLYMLLKQLITLLLHITEAFFLLSFVSNSNQQIIKSFLYNIFNIYYYYIRFFSFEYEKSSSHRINERRDLILY